MLKLLKPFLAAEATPESTPMAAAKKPTVKVPVTADQLAVELEVNAIVAAQADLALQRQGFRDGYLDYRLQRYLAESSPAELRPAVRTALERRLELIARVRTT